MEAIRNYLESMFMNLPMTAEVLKAKDELLQMMEDKYTELKEEGKSENEAVGIVISEFGNLEELAEDLGIRNYMRKDAPTFGRRLSLQEATAYVKASSRHGFMIALGVLLCINCVFPVCVLDSISLGSISVIGVSCMFLMIAIAVGLFIFSGISFEKWNYIKEEPCIIDYATTLEIKKQKDLYRTTHAILITFGIVLCILSVLPEIVIDELNYFGILNGLGGAFLFPFVGLGVFMMILTNYKNGAYSTLLNLNPQNTVAGSYAGASNTKKRYKSKAAENIMSCYWKTITCIYLSFSFLTFAWNITWIIWPLAAIIYSILGTIFEED